MKEKLNLKYDAELKKNISEVTSISIDNDYDIEDNLINGYFEVTGTYKSHGLSLNQDNFNFKVPFEYELDDDINPDTIKLDILDFTYNIDSNYLCVDITYLLEGESIENNFDDLEEFNRFLDSHEVDIVNLSLPKEEITIIEEPIILDTIEETEEISMPEQQTIINNVSSNEKYITYHIYICNELDTLSSISQKYNIKEDILKEYNNINEITLGTKLIIPLEDE